MRTIIIDVRTRKEFSEGALPGALNLPSNEFQLQDFTPYKDYHICLVCGSGNRAKKILNELQTHDFKHLSILDKQMTQLEEQLADNNSVWTVDRQFRLILAILLGIFLAGTYFLNTPQIYIIPIIIFAGLLNSAITDNCYLKMLIGIFPWNKKLN